MSFGARVVGGITVLRRCVLKTNVELHKVLALCDGEEDYAQLMSEFLRKHKNLPWVIHTYTNVDDLQKSEKSVEVREKRKNCVKKHAVSSFLCLFAVFGLVDQHINNIQDICLYFRRKVVKLL